MSDFILGHEPAIRLGAFLGIPVVMAGWEALAPRRPRSVSRWLWWPSNLGIVVFNATAMFDHGNVGLPAWLDRMLRWIVVTPDMHRVHHSVVPREANSNFGFNLPWWDRLFGTYCAEPTGGQAGMTIGLERFRDPGQLRIDRMLLQPLVGCADAYPIERQGRPPI